MKLVPLLLALGITSRVIAAGYPAPVEGDFTIKDFRFGSGEVLPELRIHYTTVGTLRRDARGRAANAVLSMHGTGGSGTFMLNPDFAGELFGPGQPLDATKYFIILPDAIGHGKSSKPSDGLRARFPRYGYRDMVAAVHRLLTEGLGVDHVRLVFGQSMGGMHTWLMGEMYPDFMDALMPFASLPTQIAGRNRAWRRVAIDAIRNDPQWQGGDYTAQPPGLRTAVGMSWLMGLNPVIRQNDAPTLARADAVFDAAIATALKTADANDTIYALEASHDYDPGPDLEKIRAPLFAINSADDLINPPELGILEREIRRVPRGRAWVIPLSDKTKGHQSHRYAILWRQEMAAFLAETER
jgi:homoserine O-acetyltransferase